MAMAAMAAMSLSAFAADGAAVYKAKCASCHGADGAGAMAKKMGSRDLNSADFQKTPDADVVAVITKGKGKMPGYDGKLTADEITATAKYLKTLK